MTAPDRTNPSDGAGRRNRPDTHREPSTGEAAADTDIDDAVTEPGERASLVITDPGIAAARLRRGGVVALPTETVYGLAADATNADAVGRVFDIKGRPGWHPLIVHFGDAEPETWEHDGWIAPGTADTALLDLARTFWPGPLTVIVAAGPSVSPAVTGGRSTVGIRVPAHPAAAETIRLLGVPAAAPSANRFGRVSPTCADHVGADIGALLTPGVDAILDGGPSACGVESTIVDLSVGQPQILRVGAIDAAMVEAALGPLAPPSGPQRASGMLAAHYAPSGFVAVVDDADTAHRLAADYSAAGLHVEIIDRSADPTDAARHLYADLRRADAPGIDGVVVVQPPALGIGVAVRDRLQRAATGAAPPSRGR